MKRLRRTFNAHSDIGLTPAIDIAVYGESLTLVRWRILPYIWHIPLLHDRPA